MWHDHSEIANHGHLLVVISAIYDPAFYYTNSEMEEKSVFINVESVVVQCFCIILEKHASSTGYWFSSVSVSSSDGMVAVCRLCSHSATAIGIKKL